MAERLKPFVISSMFDVPRERVWDAWTEVEHLKHWFKPKDFTVIAAKMDFRIGGVYHYGLRMPNGQEMWGRSVYREIKKPESLVWINSFSDKDGGLGVHPINPDRPRQMLTEPNGPVPLAKRLPRTGTGPLLWGVQLKS